MNIEQQVSNIRALLVANIDLNYLQKAKQLIPSKKPIMGVKVPQIRKLTAEYYKQNQFTYNQSLPIVEKLLSYQVREEMLFAIFLLLKYKKQFDISLLNKLDRWIEYIENWEVCDQMAKICAEITHQRPLLFKQLLDWNQSSNFWRRRLVLATSCSLNHYNRSYVKQTISLCDSLMTDENLMVKKAIPWALREASKKDPQQVFDFLLTWKGRIKNSLLKSSAQKLPEELLNKLLS